MKRRDFVKNSLLTATFLANAGNIAKAATSVGALQERSSNALSAKKIDSYSHFSFLNFFDYLEKAGSPPLPMRALFKSSPPLIDVDRRLDLMSKTGLDISVLVPLPWLELAPSVHANAKVASDGARFFNDQLAKVVSSHPKQFRGVAMLPTTNPEVMVAELDRAVKELGFVGGFMVVGPTVKRADHPDYEALYRRAEELDVPIWLHPCRPATYPDYVGEKMSEYQIFQAFGWLEDSTAAMTHIVFSGVFDRYPRLKLIAHHHGALVPMFASRLETGIDFWTAASGREFPTKVSKPYVDHFKKFYVDTATQGYGPLELQIAHEFFGPDRLLFGCDAPMELKQGMIYVPETIRSIEAMTLSKTDREKVYSKNAIRLLKLSV